ncbi:chlorophyll a/b-binding protein domain-containing protein, partial [Pavlovales sp. CCMP2436]|mmetsp:Transcript_25073/g.63631  ORF Transcript_25073/g.63631 Transcript_25073/m.63631 type:complete len:194 (-) Transcript_25073:250-831(-)
MIANLVVASCGFSAAPVVPRAAVTRSAVRMAFGINDLYGADVETGGIWDPAGFTKNTDELVKYRKAELKHGRLAMLASFGMLVQELKGGWANDDGLFDGSGPWSALVTTPKLGLFQIIVVASIIELATGKAEGRVPGDIGFDPLGLSEDGIDPKLAVAELKNGRLAMLATIAFWVQSSISGEGVLKTTFDALS